MGRSRCGLTTKIHALIDAAGRPIRLKLTAGQAHDGRSAADMFETVGLGQILLADRAYDRDGLRQDLKARGAWGCIRPMPNRVNIPAFSAGLYKNVIQWRGFSTNSNTSVPSQHDTTSAMTTSSHPLNSLQFALGSGLMSRPPKPT